MVGSVAVAMGGGGGDGGGGHTTEDKVAGDAANEQPAEEKNVSNGQSGYKISGRDVLRWM